MKLNKFSYEGKTITFEFKDGVRMVNATEMAKPFNKRVNDFLRLSSTQTFVSVLSEQYGDSLNVDNQTVTENILRVSKGGLRPDLKGTWMCEILALKFAAWLSAPFEIWVYERIKEILTNGETRLDNREPNGFATTLRIIADQMERLELTGIDHESRISEIEAKLTSADENYYTIAGFCTLHGINCPLAKAKAWGKIATSISNEKNYPMGVAHSERYGKVKTYHREVLEQSILRNPLK